MAYDKTVWDETIPVTPARLNNLETQHEKAVAESLPRIGGDVAGNLTIQTKQVIHAGNIGNYAPPPLNYDGNTADLTVYADAVNGNDNNSGLTSALAKKTVAAALALLPLVSPRRRWLHAKGTFNETITIERFVGGEFGIYCTNDGSVGKLKGLIIDHCACARYHIYNIDIGDFDASNQVYAYPLWVKQSSGHFNIASLDIMSRSNGLVCANVAGFVYCQGVTVSMATGSGGGTAFDFTDVAAAHIDTSCSSPAGHWFYGLSSVASTVFAKIAGINGTTQVYRSAGGQAFTY